MLENLALLSALPGAIVGGVTGALAGYYLSSPRPNLRLSKIMLTPVQPDITDEKALSHAIVKGKGIQLLQTPPDLLNISRNSVHINTFSEYYQHPAQYTYDLFGANKENEIYRRKRENIPQLLKELQRLLYAGLLHEFLLAWEPYNTILWAELIAGRIRKNFDIPEIDKTYLASGKPHQFMCDEDGDYFVLFERGAAGLTFQWKAVKLQREVCEPFAQKVATAFAYEHSDSLKIILKFLQTVAWDDPSVNVIKEIIYRELSKYSKVIVTGVLTNAGRHPLALAGSGKLTLMCRGFEYQSDRQSGPSVVAVDRDIRLDMVMANENALEPQYAIVVKGGEAVYFEAQSLNYLYQMSDQELIQKLFGSERTCILSFPRLDLDRNLDSVPIKFTEFSADEIFR